MRVIKCVLAVTVPVLVTVSTAGCSEFSAGFKEGLNSAASSAQSSSAATTSVASRASTCTENSFPLYALKATHPEEPKLEIPQPPGWEPTDLGTNEVVRGMLGNGELTDVEAKFAPTAAITLEDLTGKVDSPEKALDAELAAVGLPMTTETPGTVCGYPSVTASYIADKEKPTTTVSTLVVAGEFDGKLYAATVSIQSTQPDNPTYVSDKNAMLEGFRFQPPTHG